MHKVKQQQINVAVEQARLEKSSTRELRDEYAVVCGEPSRSGNRAWLVKRILWRLQANAMGSLSERALRRAEELADEADVRLKAPKRMPEQVEKPIAPRVVQSNNRLPIPGTVLTRMYKGREVRVTVLASGFEHEGVRYPSLTAVARAVTGTHWNGYHFFGLRAAGGGR